MTGRDHLTPIEEAIPDRYDAQRALIGELEILSLEEALGTRAASLMSCPGMDWSAMLALATIGVERNIISAEYGREWLGGAIEGRGDITSESRLTEMYQALPIVLTE